MQHRINCATAYLHFLGMELLYRITTVYHDFEGELYKQLGSEELSKQHAGRLQTSSGDQYHNGMLLHDKCVSWLHGACMEQACLVDKQQAIDVMESQQEITD